MASIEKKKLSDSVIDEIRRRIESGELREGDKLPNQIEFAHELGVSRASLREALHVLNLVGAIEQRPGVGTIIRSSSPALWTNQLMPPLLSDKEATFELIWARKFIEVSVVELAVENASEEEIERIGELVKKMDSALREDRTNEYSELDMHFHNLIADSSHNRYMVHMFLTIRGLMEQFIREAFIVMPGLLERSLEFHKGIYKSIKNRNAETAKKIMADHIIDIETSFRSHIEKNE